MNLNWIILKSLSVDIRTAELVIGRSINLALSVRGRTALREVGLEDKMLKHGIPMYGRMIHNIDGTRNIIPYDRHSNQAIYSVGRKYLNEILLTGRLTCNEEVIVKIVIRYIILQQLKSIQI